MLKKLCCILVGQVNDKINTFFEKQRTQKGDIFQNFVMFEKNGCKKGQAHFLSGKINDGRKTCKSMKSDSGSRIISDCVIEQRYVFKIGRITEHRVQINLAG